MRWKPAMGLAVFGLVLTFGAVGSLPASAATTPKPNQPNANTAPSCRLVRDDQWPDWVNGQPAGFDAGDSGGVYLWHDTNGFHLRVTHKTDDKAFFAGTLHTSGAFADVTGVALEGNDHFSVGPDHHEITFRFVNYGHVDGLDFHTRCAPAVTMGFSADGHNLPANRVVIGHLDRHPATNPFTIVRNL
jgi:hypothetical protein